MHFKQVKVRSEVKYFPELEPKTIYREIVKEYGDKKSYIFESLAKSEFDSNYSVIGFNPILTIKIYRSSIESEIRIDGNKSLCDFIIDIIHKTSYLKINCDRELTLNNKNLFDFIRLVQSLFHVEKKIDGFNFGFTGYFGYDTTWYIEDLPDHIEKNSEIPDIYLNIYQGIISFDLKKKKSILLLNWLENIIPRINSDKIIEILTKNELKNNPFELNIPKPKNIKDSIDKKAYLEQVDKALKYIQIGDIYQVQLGHELSVETEVSPYTVYERLCFKNPSPYMYLFNTGKFSIVGASPELFVSLKHDVVTLRPIAGTIKKGQTITENINNKETLINDQKEKAEHIMLVDLCRNDIGRICKKNTLKVDKLMYLEEYSHLYHLVSCISGEKNESLDIYDVIFATFPEGTMTGAPKIRAMEIIEELETSRRGIYAGTIGMIDFAGDATLALCIRTTIKTDNIYQIRASAGIVADSIPSKEWNETLTKMQAVYWAVTDEELVL